MNNTIDKYMANPFLAGMEKGYIVGGTENNAQAHGGNPADKDYCFYIGIGENQHYYVLREWHLEYTPYGERKRDALVKILAQDWETALAKAKAHCQAFRLNINKPAQLPKPITRTKRDHTLMPFGKYAGTPIADVKDAGYLKWAVDTISGDKYAQEMALMRARLGILNGETPETSAGTPKTGQIAPKPGNVGDPLKVIPGLDGLETRIYLDMVKTGTASVDALDILVNNVEGDISQLSPALRAWARERKLIQ